MPSSLAISATTGAAPVPVPPPHASCDEDHVSALQRSHDGITGFQCFGTAGFRFGACAEAGLAQLNLARSKGALERLGIGVGTQEFNAPAHLHESCDPLHCHRHRRRRSP